MFDLLLFTSELGSSFTSCIESDPKCLLFTYLGQFHDSDELEDLSEKTKLRFSVALRNLSEPMSLLEIARTWDACARAVLLEHVKPLGGECFSSRYGTWENCLTA